MQEERKKVEVRLYIDEVELIVEHWAKFKKSLSQDQDEKFIQDRLEYFAGIIGQQRVQEILAG